VHSPPDISADNRRFDDLAPRVIRVAGALGIVGLLVAVVLAFVLDDGGKRFFHAYLVNFAYFLSLALGALFFVILQHVTRSGWSVVVRRVAEIVACTTPLLALLAIPVVIGMPQLYEWTHADAVAHDPLLQAKQGWLNRPFFIVRLVIYFAAWIGLSRYFFLTSVAQDASGDPELTVRMQRFSAPAMFIFAITLTFAAFDLLMSLNPHWYSTIFGVYYFSGGVVGLFALLILIFGVYYFSGGVVGLFALLILLAFALQRAGRLRTAITREHYHDLGKLVFAFTVFWAYIAFSQYMLIWYANIPEETQWYLARQNGGWVAVTLVLLFGHFVLPFLALVSRIPKRRKFVLVIPAIWMLLMHWVDIYWLVMPGVTLGDLPADRVPFGVMDVACFVGVGGLFLAAAAHRARNRSLVPERDPRLLESLTFENV
jgi:hypothetical protein